MKPVFIVNGTDYTEYLAAEGLKPTRNDLDADGSGRNLLDGLMDRSRITDKAKWTVSFNLLTSEVLQQLETDLYKSGNYVNITTLLPKANTYVTKTYYFSTINEGVQRYICGETVYDGVTFNITER
ncbi:MAG: hypothetical protein NC177_16375 [Ruminococcus flavefaciens]|nr:hypothetical protein [Ruminococcus flavefaciens]